MLTGNFGDIFAGYLAKKMGLPVEKLVIATNKNDVLHRVLTKAFTRDYRSSRRYRPVWILRFHPILNACCLTLQAAMVMN